MLPQAVEGRKIRLVSELFEHVGHMVENLKTTHLKFNSSPLKSSLPKRKEESNLPTIIFQGLLLLNFGCGTVETQQNRDLEDDVFFQFGVHQSTNPTCSKTRMGNPVLTAY